MKFMSFEHLYVLVLTAIIYGVSQLGSYGLNPIECIMLYGIVLANHRVMRLERAARS